MEAEAEAKVEADAEAVKKIFSLSAESDLGTRGREEGEEGYFQSVTMRVGVQNSTECPSTGAGLHGISG